METGRNHALPVDCTHGDCVIPAISLRQFEWPFFTHPVLRLIQTDIFVEGIIMDRSFIRLLLNSPNIKLSALHPNNEIRVSH